MGLNEGLEEDYLEYRIASTGYLGRGISDHGVPIVEPPGGHAIYIDAGRMLPRFVSFLQARQEPHITAQSALEWMASLMGQLGNHA